jgi:uncharacterized membrane protein YhdT
MEVKREMDRFAQASKEALWGVGLFIAYFIWWYGFGYGLGSGDPDEYTFVMGLPAWFFWSCVAGFVAFLLVTWVVVRFFFKDIPLDDDGGTESGGEAA